MYTVKVNGAERQVSEADLLAGYSHGSAAQEKMREAQEQRTIAEEVLKIFKTNPKAAFEKLGVDAKAFAEQVLNQHMEDSLLTPEQRELRDLRAWQQQQKDAETAAKQKQQEASEAAYREQVSGELQQSIVSAISSNGLPKNEYTVGRMAYYLDSAIRAGYNLPIPDLVNQIIPMVKDEYNRDIQAMLSSTPEDKLLDLLGEDFTKKTVKAHLAKVGPKKKLAATVPASEQPAPSKKPEPKSPKDFFKRSWQR
jgi:hypothetical protein